MKTGWSHLPNAGHIDRVLASVKTHLEVWVKAWQAACPGIYNAARDAARGAAWDAAFSAARDESRGAAWDAAFYAARGAAWGAAWDAAFSAAWSAISALIAWDDCAQYLDMSSDKLEMWAILSENPAAILLLPAVKAFEKIAELELA